MSSESLRLITGRQDHLGPSAILQVQDIIRGARVSAEYLFGLGENAPRAMLEHRARPQRCLRATFAPTLDCHSIGSLGSLILRLRDDGHGKVTCLGPNGIAAQLLALQDLLRWSHPKVTVLEIPDLDDGSAAYEDELIQVWAVGKPSVPWHRPCATRTPKGQSSTLRTAELTQSTVTSSESDSGASTTSSSEDSGSNKQMPKNAGAHKPDAQPVQVADMGGQPAAHAHDKPVTQQSSEDEDSSDDTSGIDESDTGGVQQQVFSRIDRVLAAGGPAADVFAAMKLGMRQGLASQSLKRQLPVDTSGTTAVSMQKPHDMPSAGCSGPLHMPKRARQNGRERTAWDAVKEHKSIVRVARNAAGSIGKHADGAAAFVVFLKQSGRWLLLNFASEARQLRQLAAHPMLRHLMSVSQAAFSDGDRDGDGSADLFAQNVQVGGSITHAAPQAVSCIHLSPPGQKVSSSFCKLIDQLKGLEHFVAAAETFPSRGYVLCAAARMQACLNLIDPPTFPLPQPLVTPPLSAILQSAAKHAADGTTATLCAPPVTAIVKDYPVVPQATSPSGISIPPAGSKAAMPDGAADLAMARVTERQEEGHSIKAAETACSAAETAEAAAAEAKASLDQARAALSAIDTAISACAGSGIGGQLDQARAEAQVAAQGRQAEHMEALARMRATAEVAEAACAAAERHCGVPIGGRPPYAGTLVPAPHALRAAHQSALPCILLGLLSQVVWRPAATAPKLLRAALQGTTAVMAADHEAGPVTKTRHGTLIRGPCFIPALDGAGAYGTGRHDRSDVPPNEEVMSCAVDVEHAQVGRLLKHRRMGVCLAAFRQAFAGTRALAQAAAASSGVTVWAGQVTSAPGPPSHRPFPVAANFAAAVPQCRSQSSAVRPVAVAGAAHVATPFLGVVESEHGTGDAAVPPAEVWERIAPPQALHEAVMRYGPPPPAAWHGPSLLFLGTGSSEPSKYRGPSAILLQVGDGRIGTPPAVLLDCGEGTWPAMCTRMGPDVAQACVDALAAVWISHKHGDHCLGLPAVVARRSPQRPPLTAVLPAAVWQWLSSGYAHLLDRVKYVHCSQFHRRAQTGRAGRDKGRGRGIEGAMMAAGFSAWQCVRVRHCFDAYGIVLQHVSGWKVVVSGDTTPCDELVKAGMGATVLVHEATFSCERLGDAVAKRHSTVGQALEVAQRMGAWRVMLTHFSQRYSKYAPDLLGVDAAHSKGGTVIDRAFPCFDGTFVRFCDVWVLPALTRVLSEFFTEAAERSAEEALATEHCNGSHVALHG